MSNCHCPLCGKYFDEWRKTRQHCVNKHKGRGLDQIPTVFPEREESMADMLMEAELNRAMGIANDDWLEDMLDEVRS